MQTSAKTFFILILGIVLIIRCLFVFYIIQHQLYAWDDSYQYLQIAKNLPNFSQMSIPPYVPDLQRMPLYPVFLWLCRLNPILILFVQMLVQSATAWYIYKILGNYTKYALYIAFAYWLMPISILFSNLVLTECLFVFFMVASFYHIKQEKWIIANILLTASIFTRPNSILILFFLLVLGFVYTWKKKTSKKLVIQFFTGLTISFICILGWVYRNYTICQEWKLSLLRDNTLIHGRLGGLLCYQKKLPYTDDNLVCQSEAYLIQHKVNPLKKYYTDIHRQETEIYTQKAHNIAYNYILQNFFSYTLFQFDCAFELYKGMGYKSWLSITENKFLSAFLAFLQVIYTLICVFVLFRTIVKIRKLDCMQLIVLCSVLVMIILALLPYADTRYRFPIDSLIFLLYVRP